MPQAKCSTKKQGPNKARNSQSSGKALACSNRKWPASDGNESDSSEQGHKVTWSHKKAKHVKVDEEIEESEKESDEPEIIEPDSDSDDDSEHPTEQDDEVRHTYQPQIGCLCIC